MDEQRYWIPAGDGTGEPEIVGPELRAVLDLIRLRRTWDGPSRGLRFCPETGILSGMPSHLSDLP